MLHVLYAGRLWCSSGCSVIWLACPSFKYIQEQLDGFPWNFTFMVLRQCILMTWWSPDFPLVSPTCHLSSEILQHLLDRQKMFHIYGFQIMYPNYSGDPLTFPPVPSWGWHLLLGVKCLIFGTNIKMFSSSWIVISLSYTLYLVLVSKC